MTETCSNIVRQHCGDSCLAEIKKKTKKHILDRPVSGFKAELDVADLASTVLQDEVDVLIVFEETVKLHHVNMIKGSMKFNLAHYLHTNRSQIITIQTGSNCWQFLLHVATTFPPWINDENDNINDKNIIKFIQGGPTKLSSRIIFSWSYTIKTCQ